MGSCLLLSRFSSRGIEFNAIETLLATKFGGYLPVTPEAFGPLIVGHFICSQPIVLKRLVLMTLAAFGFINGGNLAAENSE